MSKQTLTIKLDIPTGYELTGEFRPPREGDIFVHEYVGVTNGASNYTVSRPLLRKAWQPPPWLPNGRWVFRSTTGWYTSIQEPCPDRRYVDGLQYICSDYGRTFDLDALAIFYGDTFTPPPVNKIQIVKAA